MADESAQVPAPAVVQRGMIPTKPRGRPATPHEINAAEMRAKRNEHTHAYFNHPLSLVHVVCACGRLCRRDVAPADLVFEGPARPARGAK